MSIPDWSLRRARVDDRDFLYKLNAATMREHVERVWGWDDERQVAFFDNRFHPDSWQVIQSSGHDIGVLIVEETDDDVYLAELQISPEWQGRGIGTSIIRSLMNSAAGSGRPLTLRVLHVNERALALYQRLGFLPLNDTDTHAYFRWRP